MTGQYRVYILLADTGERANETYATFGSLKAAREFGDAHLAFYEVVHGKQVVLAKRP